jgi:hypothetical protein
MAAMPALASGLAPHEEAGQYMAYNNVTTASFERLLLVAAGFYVLGGVVFSLRVTRRSLPETMC